MPDTETGGRGFPFAAIGLNHGHIYGQCEAMEAAGCRLKSFFAPEDDLASAFSARFPDALRVADERAILDDPEVLLVAGAGIPVERTPMAVRAMRAGKDVMLDKPGCVTLAQLDELRRVQAETGRILSICYSEHLTQRATVAAGDLVEAGAIGEVIHAVGLGPHRLGNVSGSVRPDWFWDPDRNGPILVDIASHQVEQFLFFTGAETAEVASALVGNLANPEHPRFQDFGQMVLRAGRATGVVRVDWFTPKGSPVWGDGRLFLLGTEGTIELRKYADIEGRPGGDHLFLTDGKGTRYMDCSATPIRYGAELRDDVRDRTETAMPQRRCFAAMEVALRANDMAVRVDADPGIGS